MINLTDLILYVSPTCPFCHRVLYYLEVNKIDINIKDTTLEFENREDLIQIGGKSQVPCLIIKGAPLYESNDIINWFKKNIK